MVRRVPLWFRVAGPQGSVLEPGFALEIAARHLDVAPEGREHDRVPTSATSPYSVPSEADGLLLNFHSGSADFPVYSLADLHACPQPKRNSYFRQHFDGKIVLFGAVLDAEDRILTSKRFITGSERDRPAPRCVHPVMKDLFPADARKTTHSRRDRAGDGDR